MKSNLKFWSNLSFLNQLLKKHKGLSLSEWLEWPTRDVVALELGDAPTIDQLSQLHKSFGLSYQDLIERDLTNSTAQILEQMHQRISEMRCEEPEPIYEISLYPQKAIASPAHDDGIAPIKRTSVARICVPQSFISGYPGKGMTAFEISGYSMHPNVQSGDVVLGVPIKGIHEVKDGGRYMILLKTGKLLFKRAYHLSGLDKEFGLQLSSDNLQFPAFSILKDQVDKLWKFTHHLGRL